jgi:hypothetical protein
MHGQCAGCRQADYLATRLVSFPVLAPAFPETFAVRAASDDPAHPARTQARGYREALRGRLTRLATQLDPAGGPALGGQLAVLVDGAYTSAAHLGPHGPAADGLRLARDLVRERR